MKVLLINKEKIKKINLSRNFQDSYLIKDESGNKIIRISLNNEQWVMESNNYCKIINPKYMQLLSNKVELDKKNDMYLRKVILKENDMYAIAVGNSKNIMIIYCSNENSNSFQSFKIIDTDKIFIGFDNKNNITYNNYFVSNIHAKIYKYRGNWFIENYDKNYGTFVNFLPVYNNVKKLFNGDIVFIIGLKIVMVNDCIYINNPSNKVQLDNEIFSLIKRDRNIIINQDNNEYEIDDLSPVDYFFRGPRLTNLLQVEEIKIDPPPSIQSKQEKPLLLTLGSSLAMGAVMIASLINTIQGHANGTSSMLETIISLLTAVAMLVGIILIPFLDIKYNEKTKKKYMEKRKKRYKEYLNKKLENINSIKSKNRGILYKNYLSSEECARIIAKKDTRLWEREIKDVDFLTIRLGVGNAPFKIKITYPEESFSMEDDELLEELNKVVKEAKVITDVPLTLSLMEKNISGIISEDLDFLNKYIKNIIIQLITLHSYTDLKIVFLLNNDTFPNWEYVKMLPHVWDNAKQVRFFANNYEDINELSRYLAEEFEERLSQKEDFNSQNNSPLAEPYYLIITDDYKSIKNVEFIQNICNSKRNLGFSLLCITDEFNKLPKECKTFVEVNKDKGVLFDNVIADDSKKWFKPEPLSIFLFENINQILSNTPIMTKSKDTTLLPKNYTFLEMFNVGNIEQLKIYERWKNSSPTLSLKAPIGIDSKGDNIYLDIHEKYHGPHGLIAGSTGSGKSEFIITYILSLAINYHPDDVTFLLIDYKGGGLSGAFQKNDIKLPHLVGIITNIDRNGLQRSFISIQSELRRRQVLFNKARDMTDEGTIDIYKYQKLYHDGVVKEPIPHLLIVCDEFAELKQQQPDFMDELISVSRIGRSLGVHLILATQKPAGIVNDQIRSNSKFAICLKVQDLSDSIDIINKPDAAYLKNPGQFYMQVGHSEYFALGQSRLGWSKIYSREKVKEKN